MGGRARMRASCDRPSPRYPLRSQNRHMRGAQPRRGFDLGPIQGPVQRGAEVVFFAIQPVEPLRLNRPGDPRFARLGERQEERGVPVVDHVGLIRRVQAIARVLPHGLQHLVARLVLGPARLPQQAVFDQGRDPVQHVDRGIGWTHRSRPSGQRDRLGGFEGEAADEDPEPAEQGLLGVGRAGRSSSRSCRAWSAAAGADPARRR